MQYLFMTNSVTAMSNNTGRSEELNISSRIPNLESSQEISSIGTNAIPINSISTKPLSEFKVTPDSLQQSLKSTKLNERKVVFDTLKKKSAEINEQRKNNMLGRTDFKYLEETKCIRTRNEGQYEISESRTLYHDLKMRSTVQQKVFQHVVSHYVKRGQLVPDDIVKILNDQKYQEPKELNTENLIALLDQYGINGPDADKIVADISVEVKVPIRNLKKDADKLIKIKREIEKLVNNNSIQDENLKDANLELKNLLRAAFENKAYKFLKQCEDNPTIRYLHDLNLAMYTETPLLHAYLSKDVGKPGLGNQIYKNAKNKNEQASSQDQVDILTKPGSFINNMRNFAVKSGLYSSHSCLSYVVNHFTQFFGAFASTKFGSFFFDYDPAGKLGNNVGALSTETFEVFGKNGAESVAKSIDVRTPSPTIGKKIAPEFRAALQAMENQKIAAMYGSPNEEGKKGYDRPNCWIYANFQDLTDSGNGENGRSVPLMNLNKEFPLSFKGITLSKDSEYFLDGLGHGSKMWDKIDKRTEVFNAENINEFIEEMKTTFCQDAHFTLENRTQNKGAGLYFPASNDEEKAEFKGMIESIIDHTGQLLRETLENKDVSGREEWQIKVAAKEFVYAAIQGKMRNDELASQSEKLIDEPKVVTTGACKEDIDRGFSDHVKKMWLASKLSVQKLAKIISLPALMARFRVILDDRIQPLVGLFDHFNREKTSKAYQNATAVNGVTSTDWKLNDQLKKGKIVEI